MISSANNNDSPLVTVAMPVYNAGNYLRLAVLSIIQQTFTNWEFLILDDGSTDNAFQQIADINDPRIQILRDGENKGLAVRLNECIELARGKYFARMDQDDVSYPERFKQQIDALNNDPQLDLIGVRALAITSDNNATGLFPYFGTHEKICAKPWVGFYLPHPTWMGKSSWFKKYRYTLPGPFYSEDMDLLLRSYSSSRFAMLPSVLFAYRMRRDIVLKKQLKARKAVLGIQWQTFSRNHQWGYIFLSTLIFILRLASDCVRITKQYMQISDDRFVGVPDNVKEDWNKIRNDLLNIRVIAN